MDIKQLNETLKQFLKEDYLEDAVEGACPFCGNPAPQNNGFDADFENEGAFSYYCPNCFSEFEQHYSFEEKIKPEECPNCKSKNLEKRYVDIDEYGKGQRTYFCNDCSNQFNVEFEPNLQYKYTTAE
jgi:transposase-like protein